MNSSLSNNVNKGKGAICKAGYIYCLCRTKQCRF